MFKREAEGESSMTISAQVIDTIVEWIDDNLHQPLRIEEIARHAGYSKWHLQRLFMQYKGESLGRYIRERKLLMAARDLRSQTSACTISACATGLTRSRRLPASLPAPSTSRPGRTAKRITARHIEIYDIKAG
nr:helix-turn-helix domain protein [uncultured bacterium]